MQGVVFLLPGIIIGIVIGFIICFMILNILGLNKVRQAEIEASRILKQAEQEGEAKKLELLIKARDESAKLRQELENSYQQKKKEIRHIENRLNRKEEILDKKIEDIEKREKKLQQKENEIKKTSDEIKALAIQQRETLENIAKLTTEEAKKYLLNEVEKEIRGEAALKARQVLESVQEKANKEARKIISLAIQRCAVDHVAETTVSVVNLPNEEMKGRIIGREGRNIRLLETLTGIDLIIDDTPEAVILSGFNPIRREIAKVTLEKLIMDGRIHPARIEEMYEKTKAEIEEKIKQLGEEAALELGITGLHPEIIKMMGKLYYRTSYGQNILQHSKEVAYLAALMAAEIGADIEVTKRAGFLHDIGKGEDQTVEGPHALIGAEIAQRYGESKGVVHAIASHHEDEPIQTIEAVLVQSADAISAARPGARRETLESYIRRLDKLEKIADSFVGVNKAYAIQAGREIRIIVKPEEIDDYGAIQLSRDVVKKIEKELEYPGQIKVTVIRETRAVEYAK